MNTETRDALLRLQGAMNRMHVRVAALEAATVLLLRTNAGNLDAVSYTHLTLPTICSV